MNYIRIELLHLVQVEDKVEIIRCFINILQLFQMIFNILKKLIEEEVAHMQIIVQ